MTDERIGFYQDVLDRMFGVDDGDELIGMVKQAMRYDIATKNAFDAMESLMTQLAEKREAEEAAKAVEAGRAEEAGKAEVDEERKADEAAKAEAMEVEQTDKRE